MPGCADEIVRFREDRMMGHESDEEFANRIWREAHDEARATLQRELYGGFVIAAPLALLDRGVGAGRRGIRLAVRIAAAIAALLELAAVLLGILGAVWLALAVRPYVPWDGRLATVVIVVVVVVVVAIAAGSAYERRSKRRT